VSEHQACSGGEKVWILKWGGEEKWGIDTRNGRQTFEPSPSPGTVDWSTRPSQIRIRAGYAYLGGRGTGENRTLPGRKGLTSKETEVGVK